MALFDKKMAEKNPLEYLKNHVKEIEKRKKRYEEEIAKDENTLSTIAEKKELALASGNDEEYRRLYIEEASVNADIQALKDLMSKTKLSLTNEDIRNLWEEYFKSGTTALQKDINHYNEIKKSLVKMQVELARKYQTILNNKGTFEYYMQNDSISLTPNPYFLWRPLLDVSDELGELGIHQCGRPDEWFEK